MKNKFVFVSGIAVGFVLGIRAGRDSYEKLKVKIRGLLDGPPHRDNNVSDTAGPSRKKAKEEITGAPPHDTTPSKDEEISGTPQHEHAKAYALPESDFYGIGGPASHESLDRNAAQQAHHDETGGRNRTD